MKAKIFIIIIIFGVEMFSSVSLPSSAYGARTFGLIDSNYINISYPFDMGFTTVGDIDPNAQRINIISKYDSWQQKWYSAAYISELETWATNFMIHLGNVYRVYVYSDYAPSLGFAGQAIDIPSYNLTTYLNQSYFYKGYNFIMHHPEKSDIKTAIQLGNDLVNCDWVVKKDPYTNAALSANFDDTTGAWNNDFNIYITDPLMVNVWTPQIWPAESAVKGDVKGSKQIVQINDPMPVYYHIQSSSKGDYDFSDPDSKSIVITFKAWITGRENEVLTHEDYGCGFEQIGDLFSAIYINLGNFETQWTEGDEVNFLVTDESTKDNSGNVLKGSKSYSLTNINNPIFRGFEPVIKNSGDPIVLGTPASEEEIIPYITELYQNYPNPFNPVTTIKFSLQTDCFAQLDVYNYNGQIVKSLVNSKLERGSHSVVFNADQLSSGVYYYMLRTDTKTFTKKMLIIK